MADLADLWLHGGRLSTDIARGTLARAVRAHLVDRQAGAKEADGARIGKRGVNRHEHIVDVLAKIIWLAVPVARLHKGDILAQDAAGNGCGGLAESAIRFTGRCVVTFDFARVSVDDAPRVWQPVARRERELVDQAAAYDVDVLANLRVVLAHERLRHFDVPSNDLKPSATAVTTVRDVAFDGA